MNNKSIKNTENNYTGKKSNGADYMILYREKSVLHYD